MNSLNVGILGHVDAGKTSLTRAIATLASTNAFDKHAEKLGRHNTIDLGFSSIAIDDKRLALIDCPGHSSLIRSVLAASTVFDMAIVVVDASHGIEQQTAEHLLLASLFCPTHVLIVLNKTDLVSADELPAISKRIRKALKAIDIPENSPIVACSVLNDPTTALEAISSALRKMLYTPERNTTSPFMMAIDHCFPVKGKGTVLTGTVLEGTLKLNSEIEIPMLREKCKVKGIQSWKEDVEKISAGERGAVLVNLPSGSFDRALISAPSTLKPLRECLATVNPVSFYKGTIPSGRKLHVSTGFDIVMADCSFLKEVESEYEIMPASSADCLVQLRFAKPVYGRTGDFYVASKLEHQGKGCRFPFHGRFKDDDCTHLKQFRRKERRGLVERVENDRSLICKDLFKKESRIEIFERMKVILSTGEHGVIEQSFGKGGKARIAIPNGLSEETKSKLSAGEAVEVVLHMKKYSDKSLVSYIPC